MGEGGEWGNGGSSTTAHPESGVGPKGRFSPEGKGKATGTGGVARLSVIALGQGSEKRGLHYS